MKIRVGSLLTAIATLLGCTNTVPVKDWPTMKAEQKGPALPIDGGWSVYAPAGSNVQLQITSGYLIAPTGYVIPVQQSLATDLCTLPPRAILAKNIRQTGPTSYEGDWAIFSYNYDGKGAVLESFAPAQIEVATDRSLAINVLSEGGHFPYTFDGLLSGGDRKVLVRSAKSPVPIGRDLPAASASYGPVNTSIRPEIEYRLTTTDEFEVPAGSQVRINHTEERQHEVSIGVDLALEGKLDVDVLAWLKASVRAQIERKGGEVNRESKGTQKEVVLDGRAATRYRVEWFDRIQKGTVAFTLEGQKPQELPFEIKEGEYVRVTPLRGES